VCVPPQNVFHIPCVDSHINVIVHSSKSSVQITAENFQISRTLAGLCDVYLDATGVLQFCIGAGL
jgi:hypothetical protein